MPVKSHKKTGLDYQRICMDNKISPIHEDKIHGRLVWTAIFLKMFLISWLWLFLQISLSEITFLSNQIIALGLLTFIPPIWKTNEAGRITIWDTNQKCCLFFWELDFQLMYFPLKAPPAIHWITALQGKPAAWPKVFLWHLISGEKKNKKSKWIIKMNAEVAAMEQLEGQVKYLNIATRALSFRIWPKKFNGWLIRVTGKDKTTCYH